MASHFYWIAARLLPLIGVLVSLRGISLGLRDGIRPMFWHGVVFLVINFAWEIALIFLN